MARSNFDWVVVFSEGTSKVVKTKQTPQDVLNELHSDVEVDTDDIISIIRLELTW